MARPPSTDWDDPLGYLAGIRTHLNEARVRLLRFLRTDAVETTGNRPLTGAVLNHLYQAELGLIMAQLRAACPACAQTGFDRVCSEHHKTARNLRREVTRAFLLTTED